MNKKGFTLVEVLAAAGIFIIAVSGFAFMLKASAGYLGKTRSLGRDLYQARSRMEELWRATPSEEISVVSVEIGRVRLCSLRSGH